MRSIDWSSDVCSSALTDNYYVGADSAQVTALVSGPVKEVRVSGTQAVKKGDILVILDDADQRIAVADAEAALRLARQHYGQADANADAANGRASCRERGCQYV